MMLSQQNPMATLKINTLLNKMSQIVRVAGRIVKLPGLHGIWLGSDHLCRSKITLFYPNGPTEEITYEYGKWADAEKDKKILEDAKKEFTKLKTADPVLSHSS